MATTPEKTEEEYQAMTAAAEASDPYTDKNKRPDWWPADFEGHWDEAQGRWVEPAPSSDNPAQTDPSV